MGYQDFAQITHQVVDVDTVYDGCIAIGGTTTNALALRASAAYQNAAVLFILDENSTVKIATVVTYIFPDGKKINGVTSIKIEGNSPYWTFGIFSMDSG